MQVAMSIQLQDTHVTGVANGEDVATGADRLHLLVAELCLLCIDPPPLSKLEQAVLRLHRPRAYGALAITATLWDCDAVLHLLA